MGQEGQGSWKGEEGIWLRMRKRDRILLNGKEREKEREEERRGGGRGRK